MRVRVLCVCVRGRAKVWRGRGLNKQKRGDFHHPAGPKNPACGSSAGPPLGGAFQLAAAVLEETSENTSLLSRETLREAVLLWITPLEAT